MPTEEELDYILKGAAYNPHIKDSQLEDVLAFEYTIADIANGGLGSLTPDETQCPGKIKASDAGKKWANSTIGTAKAMRGK